MAHALQHLKSIQSDIYQQLGQFRVISSLGFFFKKIATAKNLINALTRESFVKNVFPITFFAPTVVKNPTKHADIGGKDWRRQEK